MDGLINMLNLKIILKSKGMNRSIILCFLFIGTLQMACKKETTLVGKTGKLTVEFVDFNSSCNWNLKIVEEVKVANFQEEYESEFLYGDMGHYNKDGQYQFGDTFTIEFEVLEECPYPHLLILCNIHGGVPIKILSIE